MNRVGDEIGRMTGLEHVSDQVDDLVRAAVNNQEREEAGLPVESEVSNLVFAGPSGTGKTTVARKIAPLYHALGITDRDHFSELNPSDLYGAVMGETQEKVRQAFRNARGGVLFIDEAYGLMTDKDDVYGKQALTTILSEINRGDTVVILGGYPDQLKPLFDANEGMARRFQRTINFAPYDAAARADIFFGAMDESKYRLASPDLMDLVEDAVLDTGGGNAGDVRNLWAEVRGAQRRRLDDEAPQPDRKAQLSTITAADIRQGLKSYRKNANVASPLRGALVPTSRKKAS